MTELTATNDDVCIERKKYFKLPPGQFEDDQNRSFQEIVQHASDAIISIDNDNLICGLNHSAELLFKYNRDALLGQPIDILIPERKRNIHANYIREISTNKITSRPMGSNLSIDGRQCDGKLIPLSIAFVQHSKKSSISFTAFCRDISERVEREHDLLVALNKAEKANSVKMQFLATMSHELRTPLNAIIGFSSLIESQTFGSIGNEKYIEYANYINESGQHLTLLINDMLDVSRLELEVIKPNPVPFSLSRLIAECINIVIGKSQEKNIFINTKIPSMMSHVVLDRKLCKQIIINLLSNAVKFSFSNGTVIIEIKQSKKYVEISIIDHGIGMDKDELGLIFNPFSKTGNSYISDDGGVGLGLTIVKKLTELQQGSISVESIREVETCFKVILPNTLSTSIQ